ncbi:hypothetical protein ABB37_02791 [Leptomonas pyrrhocoris]|uniref:Uncharacterized protein n=1 Tax=Leptomonas pyrrhocoris TaxID=157538 RepID=A0A0M9G687_LEPPY|nr:hypothetical protein ABB37_02791 [Leptomonas pyrrhocoris]KPA83076.1 hypothetical protein ABB37_02791 [Leptomonas pyrrhocoris]|eukprot:XP_015661515.1 hypothetical protein ABB37_02791 [Leptomonas pyrrhocoris]
MSGLWSFREPSFAVGTTGGPQSTRRPTHAVTEVLPVGVEYKKSLLPRTSQAAQTLAAATSASGKGEMVADLPNLTPVSSRGRQEEEDSSDQADFYDLPCARCADVNDSTGATFAHPDNNKSVADLVGRDEAISEVQRGWWRALNIDVRPAVNLPSSAHAPEKASAVDEATLQTAHLLLARVASSDNYSPSAASSIACATPVGKRNATHTSASGTRKGDASRLQRSEARRGVCQAQRSKASSSGIDASPATGSLGSPLRTGRGAQQQERPANITTASTSHLTNDTTRSVGGCNIIHGEGPCRTRAALPFQMTSAVCEEPRPELPRAPFPAEGEEVKKATETLFTGAYAGCLIEPRVGLGVPPQCLQRTLRRVHPTAPCADEQTCQEKDARVVLRHYYALWLTATEERHMQRCAASYHDYLLQCVRDALS